MINNFVCFIVFFYSVTSFSQIVKERLSFDVIVSKDSSDMFQTEHLFYNKNGQLIRSWSINDSNCENRDTSFVNFNQYGKAISIIDSSSTVHLLYDSLGSLSKWSIETKLFNHVYTYENVYKHEKLQKSISFFNGKKHGEIFYKRNGKKVLSKSENQIKKEVFNRNLKIKKVKTVTIREVKYISKFKRKYSLKGDVISERKTENGDIYFLSKYKYDSGKLISKSIEYPMNKCKRIAYFKYIYW